MNESNDKLVLFCGAGLTAPLGIPTMAQFPDRIRGSRELAESEKADFDAIQRYCNNLSATLGESARNLELLSSFLAVLERVSPDLRIPGCTQHCCPIDARKLIERFLGSIVTDGVSIGRSQSLEPVLQAALEYDTTVLTTNYDLGIEFASYLQVVRYHKKLAADGDVQNSLKACIPVRCMLSDSLLENLRTSRTGHNHEWALFCNLPDAKQFRLLKLHGSANWYLAPGSKQIEVEDRVVIVKKQARNELDANAMWLLSQNESRHASNDEYANPTSRELPLVFPPTILKPDLIPLLQEQWETGWDALSNAEVVSFIGYSFPDSDAYMRFYLASALANNPRLQRIVVIDPALRARAGLLDRVLSYFQVPHLREIVQPIPLDWRHVNLRKALSGNWSPSVDDKAIKELGKRLQGEAIVRGEVPGLLTTEPPPTVQRSSFAFPSIFR